MKIELKEDNELKSSKDKINVPEPVIIKEQSLTVHEDPEMKKYLSENQKGYKVIKYANNCEEHNQIAFIIPLKSTTGKFIIFVILNICTVGLINLFIAWFPKIKLYIYYSVTSLELASHLGIF